MKDLSGKNILITGGLGFIGSNIAHACVEEGAKVTIYDCLDPRSGGNMQNMSGISNNVEIILNDIRNFEGLCACIRDKDIVFHCAAYTSHTNSMREPIMDIEVNCKGTINLLEAIRRFNPETKLVHIGTSTQVGKMSINPIDESHPEYPVDIYSANKTASEKYVLIYGSAYGIKVSVVRLANTYGQRSNIRSADFGFMNFFIGLALKKKEISIFGDGNQYRNVNYIEDVVDTTLLVATSKESDNQVFFAVGENQLTVSQIAEAIVVNMGGSVRYIPWPKDREVIETGNMIISNKKLKSTFRIKESTPFDVGLLRTKEYFLPVLEKYL